MPISFFHTPASHIRRYFPNLRCPQTTPSPGSQNSKFSNSACSFLQHRSSVRRPSTHCGGSLEFSHPEIVLKEPVLNIPAQESHTPLSSLHELNLCKSCPRNGSNADADRSGSHYRNGRARILSLSFLTYSPLLYKDKLTRYAFCLDMYP